MKGYGKSVRLELGESVVLDDHFATRPILRRNHIFRMVENAFHKALR